MLFVSLCFLWSSRQPAEAAIPAFPGAEGYGAHAVGGRNGDVYHVTNLNASGPGSFAEAIGTVPAAGRTIVFDVSGYIRLPSGSDGTRLTASKVTIAGQTAPGDGIGFYNNMLRISGDDIIIRHLRFRRGKTESSGDCINLDSGCYNAILDHVSIQFSTDENISSFGSPPENVTMQYSLNAWGLESHSCGGLWDQNHATAHHTLWAHNHTRNPKARPGGLLEWINNVTFDWDIGFIMGDSRSNQNWKSNVINNYFIGPPGNTQSKALVKGTVGDNGRPNFTVFLAGNLTDTNGNSILDGSDKGYSIVEGTAHAPGTSGLTPGARGYYESGTPIAGSPAPAVPVTTDPALLAYKKIVSNSGALRMDVTYAGTLRDEVDTVLMNKLTSLSRFHISRESALVGEGVSNSGMGTLKSVAAPVDTDRDGMPDFYEAALGWNVATPDHSTALANSGGIVSGTTFLPANTPAGYTRLEEYLHFKAIPHGTMPKNISDTPSSLAVDLRKYTGGFSASPIFTVANVVGGTVALSGLGNAIATFTPTLNYTGRARFDFTVTDSQGSAWTQTFAAVVMNTSLPRDLTWKGASNTWDQTVPTNWLRSSNGSTVAYSNGDRVTFDQTGIAQPNVSVTGTLAPTTVEVNATGNYTLGAGGGGGINSAGTLAKRGSGTLTLAHGETYAGGTSLEEGALVLASPGWLGGGKLSMLDGTVLTNAYPTGTTTNLGTGIEVPAGNAATINTGNRFSLGGALTGAGTLNLNVQTTVSRFDLTAAPAGFTGRINFLNGGGARLVYVGGGFNGFDNASVDVGGSVSLQPQTNSGGNTLNIGALSGASAAANLAGGTAGAVAYVIGSKGSSTSFAGTITGNASLTKTGTGTLTLGGANTYTGATAVSAGALLVNGSLGATATTVASGATLAGAGSFGGTVTTPGGGTLTPGSGPGARGTFTAAGGLSATNSTLVFDLSSSPAGSNDRIAVTGGTGYLAGTNTFQVNLADGILGAGNYKLIACSAGIPLNVGSGMGMILSIDVPSGSRQTFALNRTASGTAGGYVQLTVTGSPADLTWTGANNGGTWDAQSTANFSGGPTATFFNNDAVTFNDSSAIGIVNIAGAVAPRVVTFDNHTTSYTLTATGSITGAGQLIKSGTGRLTISGSHSYSGGTTINAGSTIALANDTANASGLGTGPVTLHGGTLTMFDNQTGYSSSTLDLIIPAGQTGTLNADSRHDFYGSLTGGGTLNFRVPWIRADLFANWSAFTGTIHVTTDADGGDFRMASNYAFPGFPRASVNLADRVWAYYTGIISGGAGTTIEIGELSGSALSVLKGGVTGGRNFTYRIGGKTPFGNEVVFAGTIGEQNTSTTTSFVKTGEGTWTLSGACSWNGGTTVEQGTLKVSGSLSCNAAVNVAPGGTLTLAGGTINADSVNISAGATLKGNGTINGDLRNDSTIVLSAGGQLTINGDVVNDGTMRLTGGTALNATGSFINNGVLDLLTGAGGLPVNFVNNGVVIDSSAARVRSYEKTGNTFTVTIASYSGHNYQLQRKNTLSGATAWQNVGAVQAGFTQASGSPTVLAFTDMNATGERWFYRIQISP